MAKGQSTVEVDRPAKRATALPAEERRSMIIRATLPLLLENGEMVTTRQIAEAAGIAEGTIFRVFADKEELIAAVVEMALDTAALEQSIAAIDLSLPLRDTAQLAVQILQQRVVDIWRLSSTVGTKFQSMVKRPAPESDALVTMFSTTRTRLTVEPILAARLLRAFTLSMTHPMIVGDPMPPAEIVQLFLYGVCKDGPC